MFYKCAKLSQVFFCYLDLASALAARGCQILLEAVLAVEIALLLNEANVLQWTAAVAVDANEVIGAPDATQGGDEGSPKERERETKRILASVKDNQGS